MATTADTITAEKDLVLTPPDPVPVVTAAKAQGLVPVDDTKKSELEARVDSFVSQLVEQDVNSPEFGKRVDAITAMGQKEIRDAAGQSNRFLDRPVKAMDQETGVGKDLAQLRGPCTFVGHGWPPAPSADEWALCCSAPTRPSMSPRTDARMTEACS